MRSVGAAEATITVPRIRVGRRSRRGIRDTGSRARRSFLCEKRVYPTNARLCHRAAVHKVFQEVGSRKEHIGDDRGKIGGREWKVEVLQLFISTLSFTV